jgi:hypothetical protein
LAVSEMLKGNYEMKTGNPGSPPLNVGFEAFL